MILLSCSNCSYNGLQYGSLGLTVGYCVQHRAVLRSSDETTCPRHLRNDLGRESREREQNRHRKNFTLDVIQFVDSREPAKSPSAIDKDTAPLEADPVGEVVTNWGLLGTSGTKIASLAQLRWVTGVRAELAMLSLGRTYVRRCVANGGPWTSGLHIFWWTRQRLRRPPRIEVTDFRYQRPAVSMARQFELATWTIIMLRLQFISDVGAAAPPNDTMAKLAELDERAAEAVDTPDPIALTEWLQEQGEELVSHAMPETRYRALKEALHKDDDDDAPVSGA